MWAYRREQVKGSKHLEDIHSEKEESEPCPVGAYFHDQLVFDLVLIREELNSLNL